MSAPPPHALTLADAAALIAARRLSPVELLRDCLDRIAAVGPELNAVIRLLEDGAAADARAAEAEIARNGGPRSPGRGVPVGVKDIIDRAGETTPRHSKLCRERPPRVADAPGVAGLPGARAEFPGDVPTQELPRGWPC